jgi:hypothetical protein
VTGEPRTGKGKTPAARDDLVSIAIGLGWNVAELYREGQTRRGCPRLDKPTLSASTKEEEPCADDDLPGLSSLGAEPLRELRRHQIDVALRALSPTVMTAELELPPTTDDFSQSDTKKRREAIEAFHADLLARLTAADFRLGKAYGLGRALVDTCAVDSNARLREQLNAYRLGNLKSWLLDLKTALPEHAGEAVHQSLERWEEWLADIESVHGDNAKDMIEAHLGDIKRVLKRQGKAWRAVLTGEKDPTDALSRRDYMLAARSMLDDALALAREVPLLLRLGIPALVLVAFVGVFVAAFTESGAAVIAALGALVGALGISWAGIAKTLGSALGRARGPLWDAALDGAIADAVTCLDALPEKVRT